MGIKNILRGIFVLTNIYAAGLASAASPTSWEPLPIPTKPVITNPYLPLPPPKDYKVFHAGFGVSAYRFNTANFQVGTVGSNNSDPLAAINNSRILPMLHLNFGYAFSNDESSAFKRALAKFFGVNDDITVQMAYLHTKRSIYNPNVSSGMVWYLDGQPLSRWAQTGISTDLSAKNTLFDSGLYMNGHGSIFNTRVLTKPHAGVVFTHLSNKYNYKFTYLLDDPDYDAENFNLTTNYYGIAIGDQWQYYFAHLVSFIADIDAQLLYARSKLNASQDASTANQGDERSLSAKHDRFACRGIIDVGVQYAFSKNYFSPTLSVKGGVDLWSYNPKIITPNGVNNNPTHIAGATKANPFITAEFQVSFA